MNGLQSTCRAVAACAVLMLCGLGCPGTPSEQWRSALYAANWTPATTSTDGHFLPDFSYAGYRNSEVALPTSFPGLTSFDVVAQFGADNTGASDATAAIQSAIAAAQQAGGGVVELPQGLYRCDGTLEVTASRVVLRGAGSGLTKLWFTRSEGLGYQSHLAFRGSVSTSNERYLAVDGENRSATVRVNSAAGFAIGDDVSVGWIITDAFVAEHGMTGTWTVSNGQWRPIFRRKIVSIDTSAQPNTITLDVPLRYPAKVRDLASIRKDTGYLTECGVMSLSIANAVSWDAAWAQYQVHALELSGVSDAWIRDVTTFESPHDDADGFHLQNSGFLVVSSKRVTIAECDLEKAQNRGTGGSGYLYEVSRSSEVLIRDCIGRNGRHNFIQNWDFGTSGCVFLRCQSSGSTNVYSASAPLGVPAYCEYHHSLAMACLVDSCVLDDGWYGGNRKLESSGAGHSVTQSVYWNTSGDGTIRSFQFGTGYIIGTAGVSVTTSLSNSRAEGTAPEDYTEGIDIGATLSPRSLFDDQLARRLGK